jgi:virginiamycin B lyase
MARIRADIVDLRFDLYGDTPLYVTVGGEQSLWVSCARTAEVVGLFRDGSMERYPVDGVPHQIALSGESIWFTMPRIDAVGRIDHAGDIHRYDLPEGSLPEGIVSTDGSVGVTLSGTRELARITANGRIEAIPLTVDIVSSDRPDTDGDPNFLTRDEDGSFWFTLENDAAIVRRTVDGETRAWSAPDCIAPRGIAVDADAAWIADYGDGGLWRIGRGEQLLQRVEAWPTGRIATITADGGGGCWFSEIEDDLVGHSDSDGKITEFDISDYGTRPRGIAVDADGVAWVVLRSGGVIGLVAPGSD